MTTATDKREASRPGWLVGLGPDGEVIRATGNATQYGVLMSVLGGVFAVIAIYLFFGRGNPPITGFFALAAVAFGILGLPTLRKGLTHAPLLAFDSEALYVPRLGRVPWPDVERGWWYQVRTSTTLAFNLTREARRRLPLDIRVRGALRLGHLNFAGGILPLWAPDLLDVMDRRHHAATGRHLSDQGRVSSDEGAAVDSQAAASRDIPTTDVPAASDDALDALLDLEASLRILTNGWADEVVRTYDASESGRDDFEDDLAVMGAHGYEAGLRTHERGAVSGTLLSAAWSTIATNQRSDAHGLAVTFRKSGP